MSLVSKKYGCLVLLIIFSSTVSVAQFYNTQIEARIILEENSEFIQITGSAYNKTELSQSLRYVLSVIKNNPETSNRSKNDQAGRFILEAGQRRNLSQTTVNTNDTDRIIILLLVYDANDKLLGKDRIVLNDPNDPDAKVVGAADTQRGDGVVLSGIVIEDTKTKPGRDFYTEFFSSYRLNNINGPKIVTIKEVLTIGNNTKIQVIVENLVIFEFLIRPSNDYIKGMSNQAILRVYRYFQQLKEQKNIVKRY